MSLTGRAIHHTTNRWIVVKLRQELSGLLIIADLRELERNRSRTEGPAGFSMGIANGLLQCIGPLAGWLTVCDTDNKNRLLELVAANLGDDQRIKHTLTESGSEWSESIEALLLHHLLDLLVGANAAKHIRWDLIIVHEADFDTVIVEESGREGNLQQRQSNLAINIS